MPRNLSTKSEQWLAKNPTDLQVCSFVALTESSRMQDFSVVGDSDTLEAQMTIENAMLLSPESVLDFIIVGLLAFIAASSSMTFWRLACLFSTGAFELIVTMQ